MYKTQSPTKILTNAKIYQFDNSFDCVESLAIRNGHIFAVGRHDELMSLANKDTETVDLTGHCVIPGLIDAHVHIKSLAQQASMIDCETSTLEECILRITSWVELVPEGKWIRGRGWNQNPWGRFGTSEDLNSITKKHPIYLIAKSGHAAWVNSMALTLAGINNSTPDPEGGEIQRDALGNPTGILFENAMKLVSDLVPKPTVQELIENINKVHDRLWRFGLTGYHDFDGPTAFRALQSLHDSSSLGMRVLKNIAFDQMDNAIQLGLRTGFGDPWLRIGNIKIFADGALGPQTAAMLEPYEGQPDQKGILLFDVPELTEIILHAVRNDFGVSVHAIGDRANRVVLDALQNVRQKDTAQEFAHLRHRIEHLQLLHPDDLNRPSALKIISSMQPIHATSDMSVADRHWGINRVRYGYAWRSILDSGGALAFGSDAPIENPNPFLGVHAAVTRRRIDGRPDEEGWVPQEKIDIKDAFLAYTKGPAYAAGLENCLGCLNPGFFADLVVLNINPFNCPPDQLYNISPIGTMVGGEWKFRNF